MNGCSLAAQTKSSYFCQLGLIFASSKTEAMTAVLVKIQRQLFKTVTYTC